MFMTRFLRAAAAILAALLAASCSAAQPKPTESPRPAQGASPTALNARCAQLVLPYGTTKQIAKVVVAKVIVRAGLRVSPPGDDGRAGPVVAFAKPGVEVLVCGKYVRPRDDKVTWKGVVLLSPSDSRISWQPRASGTHTTTAWVEARKLRTIRPLTQGPA